jgi:O-acetylhomoserine (thiol)-lyase
MGGTLSAESAHRIAVGAETLALRMEKSCGNALALAETLSRHPKVSRVHYPGLASHAQHERAKSFFGDRYGTLMGIELVDEIDVFDFLNRLRVLILATHLGDNRTLVLPMAHTIYYEMGAEGRARMGISDNFLRVSVGIEDTEDLIGDFEQALA